MTTAIIRSHEPDLGLVHVPLVGTLRETTLPVRGNDTAIDVAPLETLATA